MAAALTRVKCTTCASAYAIGRCGACYATSYCSKRCQRLHYPEHRSSCRLFRAVTSRQASGDTTDRAWEQALFIGACETCDTFTTRICSRCITTFYCSPACQRADYPEHKHACLRVFANEAKGKTPIVGVEKQVAGFSDRVRASVLARDTRALVAAATSATNPFATASAISAIVAADDRMALETITSNAKSVASLIEYMAAADVVCAPRCMPVLVAAAARNGMPPDAVLTQLQTLRNSLKQFGLADVEADSLFRDPGKGHADLLRAIVSRCSEGELSRIPGPVIAAVEVGQRHVLRVLLEAGAAATNPGRSPHPITHRAMQLNRAKELDIILQHAKARGSAIDVDMPDVDGRPALAQMTRGNARTMTVLLRHGSNVHRFWPQRPPAAGSASASVGIVSAGSVAIMRTLPKHLQLLLSHGLDPNCPADVASGAPLLVEAFFTRKQCLDHGDGQGRMRAAACIDMLLAAGADPYQCDAGAENALMTAARIGSVAQLRKVLQAAVMVTAGSAAATASSAPAAVVASAVRGAIATPAASEFARRLCEPIPATATFRRPTGSVWSAATAKVLRVDAEAHAQVAAITILHAALAGIATSHCHLPGLAVDAKVEVLLEFGAGPCVNRLESGMSVLGSATMQFGLCINPHGGIGEHRLTAALQLAHALQLLQPHASPAAWSTPMMLVGASVLQSLTAMMRQFEPQSGPFATPRPAMPDDVADKLLKYLRAIVAGATGGRA